jgi:hypothetical protein
VARLATLMAKTDSFFIRASTNFNGVSFEQSSIDLGSYVDALGKSVLRIHNISVAWGEAREDVNAPAGLDIICRMQLTTQSQGALVKITDKSVIASGAIQAGGGAGGENTYVSQTMDIAPQHWTNGYLVGVEQIYLGVDSNNALALGLTSCSIILECTVETLSSSAAMALALSQQ